MIDNILTLARELRAGIPSNVALTDAEVLRSDAAQLLRRAADHLAAADVMEEAPDSPEADAAAWAAFQTYRKALRASVAAKVLE